MAGCRHRTPGTGSRSRGSQRSARGPRVCGDSPPQTTANHWLLVRRFLDEAPRLMRRVRRDCWADPTALGIAAMSANYCESCGNPLSAGARFCASCGRPVAPASPAPLTPAPTTSFETPPPSGTSWRSLVFWIAAGLAVPVVVGWMAYNQWNRFIEGRAGAGCSIRACVCARDPGAPGTGVRRHRQGRS
jgi:hypothetical protein